MSNTIAGIDLPDGVEWVDLLDWVPITGTERQTVGGVTWMWTGPRYNRPVNLAAGPDYGWIERSVYEQIRTAAGAGSAVELIWNGVTYSVMFRYADPPVISAVEVRPVPTDPMDGDYLSDMQIKLITLVE